MKATLFIIENDRDHVQAKALIEKLMGPGDVADQARMTAQARVIEAYERARWPRRAPTLPGLLTYGLPFAAKRAGVSLRPGAPPNHRICPSDWRDR